MSWYSRIIGGWRAWRRRDDAERDLDDELTSYLEAARDAHGRRLGLGLREAERAARLDVGSIDAVKDYTRDAGWEATARAFVQDVRDALRRLRRSPAFTMGAVATLAVAVGANLAIFTLVDRILLHPLDVREPNQLFVFERTISIRGKSTPYTYTWWANVEAIRNMRAVDDVAVVTRAADPVTRQIVVAGPGDAAAEAVDGRFVSSNFFRVLGVDMAVGRDFAGQRDDAAAPPVAVLSHAFWRRRFAADPAAVGRTISINDVPTTIVGVAPVTFTDVEIDATPPAVFLPVMAGARLAVGPGYETDGHGGMFSPVQGATTSMTISDVSPLTDFVVIARVAPERLAPAQAELTSLVANGVIENRPIAASWRLVPLVATVLPLDARSTVRQFMTVLGAAVALTLLLGCANLASLLAARVDERRDEITVRAALGASRVRLLRPIVAEAAVIAAAGGLAAVVVAQWIERAFSAFVLPGAITVSTLPPMSASRVLCWTAPLAVAAAVLIGIAPATRVTRWRLTAGGQRHRPVIGRFDMARVLVGAQAAIGVVLVFAAALFVRTMASALAIDPGFNPDGLLAVSLSTKDRGANARLAGLARTDAFVAAVRQLPGVVAATDGMVPLVNLLDFPVEHVAVDGVPTTPSAPVVETYAAADYFRTLQQPILQGREFNDSDAESTEPVVILSASAAHAFWPHSAAVGHHLTASTIRSFAGTPALVVGVAADVTLHDLRDTAPLVVYRAPSQNRAFLAGVAFGSGHAPVVIRTSGDAAAFVPTVTKFARDTGFSVESVRTVGEAVDTLLMPQRLGRALLTLLGALALVLTIVGVYSLVSSVVVRDRKEVGVRMALGARPRHVTAAILAGVARPLVAGLAAGVLLAWWSGRFADRFLYGARSHDPATLTIAAAAIVISSLLASARPMVRALRIDPIETLRAD
jgi:predicted permease